MRRRAVLLAPLVLAMGCRRPFAKQAALSAAEAHEGVRAGRIVLIDIRAPAERADTGLPEGALPLDMDGPAFEPRLAGIRLDHPRKPIALIDRVGGQAAALRSKLAARGWRDILVVRGGMLGPEGWLAQKLPVEAPG